METSHLNKGAWQLLPSSVGLNKGAWQGGFSGPDISIFVDGSWRPASSIYIFNEQWYESDSLYIFVDGTWRSV